MFPLTRIACVVAACGWLSTIAHAEDVYLGTATVQSEGRVEAGCVAGPVKVTVADGRFTYSNGGAPLASGPIAPDGAFSSRFANSAGPRGRVQISVDITGRVQNGNVTGSTSNSNGCVRNFTLTKQ